MSVKQVLVAKAVSVSTCLAHSSALAQLALLVTPVPLKVASIAMNVLRYPVNHCRVGRMQNVLIRRVITTVNVPRDTQAMQNLNAMMLMNVPQMFVVLIVTVSTQWVAIDVNVDMASMVMLLSPRVARVSPVCEDYINLRRH